jgi:hypothetical protein
MKSAILFLLMLGFSFSAIYLGTAEINTVTTPGYDIENSRELNASGNLGNADVLLEPWNQMAWCADAQKISGDIDAISNVPAAGYPSDKKADKCVFFTKGTGLYALKTRSGNYAAINVIEAKETGKDRYGNPETKLLFEFRYQSDGTTNMTEPVIKVKPQPVSQGDVSSGVNDCLSTYGFVGLLLATASFCIYARRTMQ